MKNYLLFTIIICFFTTQTSAQSNLDFENWTNNGTSDDPDDWFTTNFFLNLGGTVSCVKSPPHWGKYSIGISHSNVPGFGDIAGFAVQQFEFTKRAKSIELYYIYKGNSLDSPYLSISFTKGNSSDTANTIGAANFVLPQAHTWTRIQSDIKWKNGLNPDSATLVIGNSPTSITDTLFVDDIGISMWGLPVFQTVKPDFNIYLNSQNYLMIDPLLLNTNCNIIIRNSIGQSVYEQRTDLQSIDLNHLPPGMYIYEINAEQSNPVVGKFIR